MTQSIYDRFAKEYLTTLLSSIGTVHVHRCVNSKVTEINQEKPMTRFIHDRFAKELLEELLSPIGTVNVGRDVASEVREIDVYFTETSPEPQYTETLGVLGRIASGTAILEPFRNPVSVSEVCSCLGKLLDVRGELERQARRENIRCDEAALPKLWILTPTASDVLLNGFGATPDRDWMRGIYFLPESLRSAIVVIHQLPEIPETIWLRMLGRGGVQRRAIAELRNLAVDNPLRIGALELLYRLQSNLVVDSEPETETENRELIMAIAPLFQEQLQAAQQSAREEGREEGIQQGLERGRQEQQRLILENFLRVRFGELDPQITAFLTPASTVPASEFTVMLLSISMLVVDESGRQQAIILLAENVLKTRCGELGDLQSDTIAKLLALPVAELTLILEQLSQLSVDELTARLTNRPGENS